MYLYKLELYTHVGLHTDYINYDAQYSGELIFSEDEKKSQIPAILYDNLWW